MQKLKELNNPIYINQLKEHGNSVASLGWNSVFSQYMRFSKLIEIDTFDDAKSILDVGCGLGNLTEFLYSFEKYDGDYTGIDIIPEMIDNARSKYPNRLFLLHEDFIRTSNDKKYDFVFASGIFTYYPQNESTLEAVTDTIKFMWDHCKLGVAFNSLSTYSHTIEDNKLFLDPTEIFKVCKSITPYVVLRHDYFPGDFTIYMLPS